MGLAEQVARTAGLPVRARGGLSLIAAGDAPAFLDGCAHARVRVLGVEGFRFDGDAIVPDMSAIADFSAPPGTYSVAASIEDAKQFLRRVSSSGAYFDFTLERE